MEACGAQPVSSAIVSCRVKHCAHPSGVEWNRAAAGAAAAATESLDR
jgi:hypothetical protein